jgi:hypothetical protein
LKEFHFDRKDHSIVRVVEDEEVALSYVTGQALLGAVGAEKASQMSNKQMRDACGGDEQITEDQAWKLIDRADYEYRHGTRDVTIPKA